MALLLRERQDVDYEYICTPTGNELPEMLEHLTRIEEMLGKKLTRLGTPPGMDGLAELIRNFGALPNWRQRWCTRILKIEPTIEFLKSNAPCIHYVGLRADEPEREGIYGNIPGVEHRFPLRELGMGIEDVWDYLQQKGVRVPKRTDCAWCYGQRLIEWKRLWENHPHTYSRAAALENFIGHTFRSPGRDTWPASLEQLRLLFEQGRKVRGEGNRQQLELFQVDADADTRYEACRVCKM